MKRGDVWWVNFDPSLGGEIKKERLAIIISIDPFNKYANRLQVVPVTSNIKKRYPSEAYVSIAGNKNKALIDQIATVSKQRFRKKLAEVSSSDMKQIGEVIKLHFGIID
jgi:mRNA interferase MazF